MSVLTISNLSIGLPPGGDRQFAVENVSLTLDRGQILCVVGASGSGKSVLAAAIMGDLPRRLARAGGTIWLGDRNLSALTETALRCIRGNRIAMIPQEPLAALNPSIRVGRQIEEVLLLHSRLSKPERAARVCQLIASMQLEDPSRIAARYPHQLSGGQCQRIAIAMALAMHPDVLIADEPTTALDVTTQAQILDLVRDLRGRGDHGVLFITHDFGIVREIADRVAVMEAGRIVEIGSAADILERPAHPHTRALLGAVTRLAPKSPQAPAAEILRVAGLSKTYGTTRVVDDVGLTLQRGAVLAVVGESGSGKTTLARLIMRITEPDTGSITIAGEDFPAPRRRASRHHRRAIQMIFQDPYGALNPRRRVGAVIARAAVLAGTPRGAARQRALGLLEMVGLPAAAYRRKPAAFSGGQRQRIGIARALALEPQILIADECIAALDVLIQQQVLGLLAELQTRLGIAIVFITHDLRTAGAIADTIAVMHRGRIVEIGTAAEILGSPREPYTRALIAAIPGRSAAEIAQTAAAPTP